MQGLQSNLVHMQHNYMLCTLSVQKHKTHLGPLTCLPPSPDCLTLKAILQLLLKDTMSPKEQKGPMPVSRLAGSPAAQDSCFPFLPDAVTLVFLCTEHQEHPCFKILPTQDPIKTWAIFGILTLAHLQRVLITQPHCQQPL